MLFIDSNIWAYYFDEMAPEHKFVVKAVEDYLRKGEVAINTVILMEVAHFLIKNLGAKVGRRKIIIFLNFPFTIVDFTYELAVRSIHLLAVYSHLGIGGRDATILASMEKLKTNTIMTHDAAFKRIPNIKVIDPIQAEKIK